MPINNGRLIQFEDIVKNKDTYIPELAEGFVPLEKTLNQCVEKKIPTIACCAGRHLSDYPYITFVYNENTRKKINGFLNNLKDIKGTDIMFSTTGFTNNPFNVTVYANMLNREKVFNIINGTMELDEEKDFLDESIAAALRVAINMDYRQSMTNVTIFNRALFNKFAIGVYGKQYKDNIFDSNKSHGGKMGPTGMTTYIYKTNKQLYTVADELEGLFSKNGYRLSTGFHIDSHAPLTEKIDGITEYNNEIKKATGTIRRPR